MRIFIPVTILILVIARANLLQAQAVNASSIVANSPFLPPDFNPPGQAGLNAQPPVTGSQFQFRGVYQLDGEFYFHIYDQRSQKGSWIAGNGAISGYPRIVEFDESQYKLTVELDGTQLRLDMVDPANNAASLSGGNAPASAVLYPDSQATRETKSPATRRPVIRSVSQPASEVPVRRLTFSTRQNNN